MISDLDALFQEAQQASLLRLPSLSVERHDDSVEMRGTFPVRPSHASEFQSSGPITVFEIRFVIRNDFPFVQPHLFETAGRIPPIIDRHMYESDPGRCCFEVWDTWLLKQSLDNKPFNILSVLEGPVHNFFLGQYKVENGEEWPFDQYAHGSEGLLQAWSELLGCPPIKERILGRLEILQRANPPEIKRGWRCDCGSGKKIVDCHHAELVRLRKSIPAPLAKYYHQTLRSI